MLIQNSFKLQLNTLYGKMALKRLSKMSSLHPPVNRPELNVFVDTQEVVLNNLLVWASIECEHTQTSSSLLYISIDDPLKHPLSF